MIRTVAAATILVVVAACGPSEGVPGVRDEAAQGRSTCDQVRAGIDAFNDGDYAETQSLFQTAVPLAEKAAKKNPSQKASDLLEAVRYYADLSPADYPESARSSPEFEKYKQITLGQCVPVGQPDSGTEV